MAGSNADGRFLKAIIKIIIVILFIGSLAYLSYSLYMNLTYPLKYQALIKKYSIKNKVDPYLISAIIREESRFQPDVKSDKGAVGLMQVMPKTAKWVSKITSKNYPYKEGDLSNPEKNIKFGSWYFSYLKKRYKSEELALSAYNAGTSNVDKWIKKLGRKGARKTIPFPETKNFVKKVTEASEVYRLLYPDAF